MPPRIRLRQPGRRAPLNLYTTGPYLWREADIGVPPAQAYRHYRSAGGTIPEADFLEAYDIVQTARRESGMPPALNYGRYPSGDHLTRWEAGRGGYYATFVTVIVSRTDPAGNHSIEREYFNTYEANPHTPRWAVREALEMYSDMTPGPMGTVSVPLMAFVTSATHTRRRETAVA